jgi:sugar lactone lactonase YvrE
MRQMQLPTIAFLLLSTCSIGPANADAYSTAREALLAAYEAEDYAAMQAAAHEALLARPGYPAAQFNLALAKTLDGDSAGALEIFGVLAASGVDYGIAEIEELAPLQQTAGWPAYAAEVAELQKPLGAASVTFTHDRGDFVPEGLLLLQGDLLLGSIRHGEIVRIGERVETISSAATAGHWSVFGMRSGPDNAVWFASAAVAEYKMITAESLGATGLFRLDLASGEVTAAAILPAGEEAKVLGDLVFADHDTIYLTESLLGALYRYTLSSGRMEALIAPGRLRSMQGLVLDRSGKYLFIADYVGGLFRIRLSDLAIERVTSRTPINLFGIDGLYRYGDELIAIQNGNRPHRVVALKLAADGASIIASRVLARNLPQFDEPTLGTISGDDFLFVANSHWNRFGPDGDLPDDLQGPIILKISLRQP